jgi:hypothetical protein
MDVDKSALFIPDENLGGSPAILPYNVSAIQLVKKDDGSAKLGFLAATGRRNKGPGVRQRLQRANGQDSR